MARCWGSPPDEVMPSLLGLARKPSQSLRRRPNDCGHDRPRHPRPGTQPPGNLNWTELPGRDPRLHSLMEHRGEKDSWAQSFSLRRRPFVSDLLVSSKKTPRGLKGRAAFLCLGFGFNPLDFSQPKTDAAPKVVSVDPARFAPAPQSHRGDVPAPGKLFRGEKNRVFGVAWWFHATSNFHPFFLLSPPVSEIWLPQNSYF